MADWQICQILLHIFQFFELSEVCTKLVIVNKNFYNATDAVGDGRFFCGKIQERDFGINLMEKLKDKGILTHLGEGSAWQKLAKLYQWSYVDGVISQLFDLVSFNAEHKIDVYIYDFSIFKRIESDRFVIFWFFRVKFECLMLRVHIT